MTRSHSRAALYRAAMRAAIIGLVINLLLGIVKLAGGVVSQSFALISDAVNSLGDVFTSCVIVGALHFAQRPPDAEHPYGHSRAEGIAATQVALLVFLSAVGVGWEAVRRLTLTHDVPPAWTLGLAAANAAIKEALYQYKVRVSRRTGSSALLANAWDHRSDAFCSLAVLIGLGIVRWGGPAWIGADEVAALVVVAAILWSAGTLYVRGVRELMDFQADDELVERVRARSLEIAGVQGVEKLWLRKSGLEYFADLHLEVDPALTVEQGHRIGHQVKDELLADFPLLGDVLIHLEPARGAASPSAGDTPPSDA